MIANSNDPGKVCEEPSRKRKAHKKSRRGCRNCKLRRVKCDETRPGCVQCFEFGVNCNYDASIPDLQMLHTGTVTMNRKPLSHQQMRPPARLPQIPPEMCSVMVPSIGSAFGHGSMLDPESSGRLRRFQNRTSLSVSTPTGAFIFQKVSTDLALIHPYLMHVIQTLTAVHDRYLHIPSLPRQTPSEIYHLSQAASLFNQKLSSPIAPYDRDPIWATAALLGILAFAWIDVDTPEEAWPLAPPHPSDLEWMKMSENKIAVFNITNPLRDDSVFRPVSLDFYKNHQGIPVPEKGTEGIPLAFVELCDLNEDSGEENNPYFSAMHTLARLLPLECDRTKFITFLCFVTHFKRDFKILLSAKDPRALVLLAYWYAKVCRGVWWIERRAVLECQAVCLFLERFHGDDEKVVAMLGFPRMRCGMAKDMEPLRANLRGEMEVFGGGCVVPGGSFPFGVFPGIDI